MTSTKKLSLFLLPLVPLSAIGLVEVIHVITQPAVETTVCALPVPKQPMPAPPMPAPAPPAPHAVPVS